MGNPYASLSLLDDDGESPAVQPNLWQAAQQRQNIGALATLESELDEVLRLYKPHVARSEWLQLMDFKPLFLKQAGEIPERAVQVTEQLQRYKFSLLPGEKVEFNRAPATRIIGELRRILG